jgi:predicted DNA-binding transcriptional regulator AlpA
MLPAEVHKIRGDPAMIDVLYERRRLAPISSALLLRHILSDGQGFAWSTQPPPPMLEDAREAATIPALLSMKLICDHFIPVDERTIYRWLSAGEFPKADICKGGKIRLWKRETIETWIEQNGSEN